MGEGVDSKAEQVSDGSPEQSTLVSPSRNAAQGPERPSCLLSKDTGNTESTLVPPRSPTPQPQAAGLLPVLLGLGMTYKAEALVAL